MSIAKWINEATERRRKRLREEGRREGIQEGRREGIREGRREGIREGYNIGYSDAREGNPPQPPGARKQESKELWDNDNTGSRRD